MKKFKAWDKVEKRWWYMTIDGFAITTQVSSNASFAEDGKMEGIPYPPEISEWLPYIGLEDSKGKPIYEGDVERMIGSEQYSEGELQEIAMDYDRDFAGWSVQPQYAETGEVIGNIHQNPELLKEKI